MQTPRPLAVKLTAMVAGLLMFFPVLPSLSPTLFVAEADWTLQMKFRWFWRFLELKPGEIVIMGLWGALAVAVLKQSRWALAFAVVLAVIALLLILLNWALFGGIVGPSGFTVFTVVVVVELISPFFMLEAVFRLWRKGQLR
jgi:hypothetical protein